MLEEAQEVSIKPSPTFLINRFIIQERRAMLPERQRKAFDYFYDSARYNEILEPKTTVMIHMAASMAVACYP